MYSVHTFFFDEDCLGVLVFLTTFFLVDLLTSSFLHDPISTGFFLNGDIPSGNKFIFVFITGLVDLGLFLLVDLVSLNSFIFTFGL